jgi:hypothetical protein
LKQPEKLFLYWGTPHEHQTIHLLPQRTQEDRQELNPSAQGQPKDSQGRDSQGVPDVL